MSGQSYGGQKPYFPGYDIYTTNAGNRSGFDNFRNVSAISHLNANSIPYGGSTHKSYLDPVPRQKTDKQEFGTNWATRTAYAPAQSRTQPWNDDIEKYMKTEYPNTRASYLHKLSQEQKKAPPQFPNTNSQFNGRQDQQSHSRQIGR